MNKKLTELALPPHYDAKAAKDFQYDILDGFVLQRWADEWRVENNLKPVGADKAIIHLLIIDAQADFSFPQGSLFVGGRSGNGATDDNDRLARFIYRNLNIISQITPTMDTHLPFQIFYPTAHLKKDGTHPAPFTLIGYDEYAKGDYTADPAFAKQIGADQLWLTRQFIHYTRELEKNGKYKLAIWPYHCLLGASGHKLAGVIEEARLFHSFARGAENRPEIKGGNPLTEHYSIFKPEVLTLWDGRIIPGAQKNKLLIEKLLKSDAVVIAGQAKSHCLAWTIADLLDEIAAVDPNLAKKVYLLEDCTSSVVVPGVIDYTDEADKAFEKFADAGMNIVRSDEPIAQWPGIRL